MELIKRYKVLAAILAVVVAVGVGCWVYQLIFGLTVTGMNNGTSWGLYITNFMFFVGLSAGGLIVASSASVFHITKFKAVALPAIILSTVCICAAGMFVLIDLGGIQRVWRILTGPNPTSPLLWDVCVITCYLIINVFYLVFMTRGNQHAVSIVSRFALPCAILVHSVTAWIFGLEAAKEGWYTAIMAPIFVASAMDSGLALLLVVLGVLKKAGIYDTSRELMAMLAGLLCTCVAVDAFFIFCEVLTMAYPGAAGAETLALLTTGGCVLQARVALVHCLHRSQRDGSAGHHLRLERGGARDGHGVVRGAELVCPHADRDPRGRRRDLAGDPGVHGAREQADRGASREVGSRRRKGMRHGVHFGA